MGKPTLKSIAADIEVTAYLDYRVYLSELYERARSVLAPYSYEAFAEDLGFSAINTIRLVIMRKRLLADKSAQTIVKALDLRKDNRKYFLAMVKHVNARGARQKALNFKKMLDAKQSSIVSHRGRNQVEFLSEWYHWVVLEMLRLDGSEGDATKLADSMTLPVSAEKIGRSLALLESLDLVEAKGGGLRVRSEAPTILPEDETASSLAMMQHHQSMLDLAKEALVDLSAEERDFNALTVSLSAEGFQELKNVVKTFCERVLEQEGKAQRRECVAQVNINLFRLTK